MQFDRSRGGGVLLLQFGCVLHDCALKNTLVPTVKHKFTRFSLNWQHNLNGVTCVMESLKRLYNVCHFIGAVSLTNWTLWDVVVTRAYEALFLPQTLDLNHQAFLLWWWGCLMSQVLLWKVIRCSVAAFWCSEAFLLLLLLLFWKIVIYLNCAAVILMPYCVAKGPAADTKVSAWGRILGGTECEEWFAGVGLQWQVRLLGPVWWQYTAAADRRSISAAGFTIILNNPKSILWSCGPFHNVCMGAV